MKLPLVITSPPWSNSRIERVIRVILVKLVVLLVPLLIISCWLQKREFNEPKVLAKDDFEPVKECSTLTGLTGLTGSETRPSMSTAATTCSSKTN